MYSIFICQFSWQVLNTSLFVNPKTNCNFGVIVELSNFASILELFAILQQFAIFELFLSNLQQFLHSLQFCSNFALFTILQQFLSNLQFWSCWQFWSCLPKLICASCSCPIATIIALFVSLPSFHFVQFHLANRLSHLLFGQLPILK